MTSTNSIPIWLDALKRGYAAGKTIEEVWPGLPAGHRRKIEREWRFRRREQQLLPKGDWLTWLILGGRGSGKTRAAAEWVRGIATGNWPFGQPVQGPIALVAETLADAREVMIEGVSGLLRIHEERERPKWVPSRRMLVWPRTGAVAYTFSSEDPEALRGPQFAAAWADGVGHTAAAGPPVPVAGMVISREEAFEILARDLPKYERRTERALGAPVAQHVFDGAVSFDFNTGAIDRASWVAAFRAGDRAAARDRLMLWNKAGGKVVTGLVKRREGEARPIFEGDYGRQAATTTTVSPAGRSWSSIQSDLAALGFYKGAIDGLAGPETRAAVIAYQRSHPDLAVDGIVGPATLASLARDIAARKGLGEAAGAAVGGAIIAGGGAVAAGTGRPILIATLAGLALLAAAGAFVAHRYGGELWRALPFSNGRST